MNFTGVFVGYFDGISIGAKLLLESHDQFYQIQGVGSQVILKGGIFLDVSDIYSELVDDNIRDSFQDSTQWFISIRERRPGRRGFEIGFINSCRFGRRLGAGRHVIQNRA